MSTYGSYPKVTLTWSNNNLNYVAISYYGNAIVKTGTTTSSGNQTGTSWTTGDLSFNATYTFTMTPYNAAGTSGTAKTFTVDTTPKITGAYSSGTSTTSSAQIQWYGTYYYVKIWRKITSPYTTGYTEVSANTKIYTMPYNDTDLSGNTTYVYYVQPYDATDNAYSSSNTVTVTTSARVATDLSAVFYDSSSIQLSFTLPKNSYTSSYYYTLRASNSGTNTDVSGTMSPLFVKGLTSGTTYTCYILTYLDGSLASTSSGYSVTTTSGTTYARIMLVGGGGGASGGGGGAGSVLYNSTFALTTDVIYYFNIGSGGCGASASYVTSEGSAGGTGGNTILTYGSTTITAFGGGGGGGNFSKATGGGSGGGGYQQTGGVVFQTSYSGWTSYGNTGGTTSTQAMSGGGGAGSVGGTTTSSYIGGDGGSGILISDVSSTYFGGGGGGGSYQTGTGGSGGSSVGGTGASSSSSNGSSGVDNTGSGGGGCSLSGISSSTTSIGGSGGAGIAILSIPTSSLGTYVGATSVYTYGSYTNIEYKSSGLYIPSGSNTYYFTPSFGTSTTYLSVTANCYSILPTKIIFSDYNNGRIGYSSPTSLSSISYLTGYGSTLPVAIGLSANGTRGLFFTKTTSYYITWKNKIPTLTSVTFTGTSFQYLLASSVNLNYNGTRFLIADYYYGVWWGTWSSSSTSPTTTLTNLTSSGSWGCMSKDGSLIAYMPTTMTGTLYVGTWNGSGYTITTVSVSSITGTGGQMAISSVYKIIYIQMTSTSTAYYVYYNGYSSSWTYGGTYTSPGGSNGWGLYLSYDEKTLYSSNRDAAIYQIPITYYNFSTTISAPTDYVFYIPFGSSTVPTTDNTGSYTISKTGTPTISNNATRGYVLQSYSGNNIYLTISYSTTWSVCFWLYNTGGNIIWCISNSLTSFTAKYHILFQDNGGTYVAANNNNTYFYFNNPTLLSTGSNTWCHYVFTFSSGTIILYQNGTKCSSGTLSDMALTSGTSVYISFGAFPGGNFGLGLGSYFDNIRYYNRVLTSSEANSIYSSEYL